MKRQKDLAEGGMVQAQVGQVDARNVYTAELQAWLHDIVNVIDGKQAKGLAHELDEFCGPDPRSSYNGAFLLDGDHARPRVPDDMRCSYLPVAGFAGYESCDDDDDVFNGSSLRWLQSLSDRRSHIAKLCFEPCNGKNRLRLEFV